MTTEGGHGGQIGENVKRKLRVAVTVAWMLATSLLAGVSLPAAGAAEAAPIRIMLVGDSITAGLAGVDTAYRCELWLRLAGRNVDFVGLQSSSPGCGAPGFDPDHEGWGGATTAGLISEMEASNSFTLSYDAALVHIGTNDKNGVDFGWNQAYIDAEIELNFRSIVAKLREFNPGVTIYLSQLIPCGLGPSPADGFLGCTVTHDGGLDNEGNSIEGMNDVWARIAADSSTPQSPIVLVDHRVGFSTADDLLPDRVHPNGSGQAKMADNWAMALEPLLVDDPDGVLLIEPNGRWHIRRPGELDYTFWYGNPADVPLFGDWDGDGTETPGMYRPGNGFAYLTNVLPAEGTVGYGELEFFFGLPGDQVFSGDWDGNGTDTLGIARNGKMFLRNTNDTGKADVEFWFGNPTDLAFGGDPNGDGFDGIFLYRPNGFTYFTNGAPAGDVAPTDGSLFFGQASDRFVIGDWDGDKVDTVGVFRPSDTTVYLRNSNTTGEADESYQWGVASWLPTAGSPF
jgi:lysophospholipase L1-like esterase